MLCGTCQREFELYRCARGMTTASSKTRTATAASRRGTPRQTGTGRCSLHKLFICMALSILLRYRYNVRHCRFQPGP
jgi:hypothetical protein